MKRASLLLLIVGTFFVLVAISLLSWSVKKEDSAKSDQLAKAREAKKKKSEQIVTETELENHGESEDEIGQDQP